MTCQHCQTWILDGEHRCSRCGRRVRSTPSRISPASYPIAATATARAYDFETEAAEAEEIQIEKPLEAGQQQLFPNASTEPRVIPFDSLTTPADRESIRARAADLMRPEPVKTGKVEVRPARRRKSRSHQGQLDFLTPEHSLNRPQSSILCDAPVAPSALRVQAAAIDAVLMAIGSLFGIGMFAYVGGHFSFDKHLLPFFAVALLTIPVFYKVLWTLVGQDTIGMKYAGIQLVDFDGNPPSLERRYQRLVGSFISLLAAGMGMIWSLVDEDSLTWHDHMSGTFPTVL
jgi:uncharacterized RDD family membrane protein YckC